MLKPLLTCALSMTVLLAPLSAAFVDMNPHCFGHDKLPQLLPQGSSAPFHGTHHEDCRWLTGGRNLAALPPAAPGEVLLAFSRDLPLHGDQSISGPAFTDFSRRAPPLA